MIEAYYRPETLEEAIQLLIKNPLSTFPLGGGNVLSRHEGGKISVVDLQRLKLDKIEITGSTMTVGANTTVQALIEDERVSKAIKDACTREGTINNRRTSTIAGVLVSSAGQSPLGAVLLAINAKVITAPGNKMQDIDKWMASLETGRPAELVLRFEFASNPTAAYMDISKTSEDVPMIYAVLSKMNGEEKILVVGLNKEPRLFIETTITGKFILQNAYSHFRTSKFSQQYLQQAIQVLFDRLSTQLSTGGRA